MLQGAAGVSERAKLLRSDMSFPEVLLWQRLRTNEQGIKFRRQNPSGQYVADFYCHKARLVIKIDGMMHDCGIRPQRDAVRDAWFAGKGLTVIRIPATEVLKDVDGIAEAIFLEAADRIATLQSAGTNSVLGDS